MFNPPLLADVKARLADVPHIDEMSLTMLAGRMMFGLHGLMVWVDPGSTDDEIDYAIRRGFGAPMVHATNPIAATAAAEIPLATVVPPPVTMTFTPEPKPMTTPAPGSFAASLKAMLDDAQSGLAKAQDAGRARVQQAVTKFATAAAATAKVSESKAKEIEDAADSVLADLGQITNDLTGEA